MNRKTLLIFLEYLGRQRVALSRRLKRLQNSDQDWGSILSESDCSLSLIDTYKGEGFESELDLKSLSSVVDTALLRTYVYLNHALLGSLLRVPNHCDVSVVKDLLLKHEVSIAFQILLKIFC